MGERGNIVFIFPPAKEGDEPRRVYFYTHWRGHLLHEILRDAMNLKEYWPEGFGKLTGTVRESCRWYDASYFARVVFNRLTRGDEDGVLSFGIDVDRTLPDYNELHVNVADRMIREVAITFEGDDAKEEVVNEWPFEVFAKGDELVKVVRS